MFRKVFSTLLIGGVAAAGVLAQPSKADTPQVQSFSFFYTSEGGYLGVQTTEVTRDNFGRFGLKAVRGVAVEKVLENSPAAAAGLREGDVIVKLNGDEITSTRKLSRLMSEVEPDHQVRLTVVRGGTEHEITATAGKKPMPKLENGNFRLDLPPSGFDLEPFRSTLPHLKDLPDLKSLPQLRGLPGGDLSPLFNLPDGQNFASGFGGGRQIGIGVYDLTEQLGKTHSLEGGVMINEVRAGSPAEKAGLKAGDIVTEVDGRSVKNTGDLVKAINEKKEGSVTLTFVRDRNKQTVTVTPEPAKGDNFFIDRDNGFTITPRQTRPLPPPAPNIKPAPAPDTIFHLSRVI
jgi:serine protease Do